MGYGTCDLDAQQSRDTKQESEEARYQTTPDKDIAIPLAVLHHCLKHVMLPMENHEGKKEHSRTCICPPCEFDGRIIAIRQGALDKHSVKSYE